MSRDTARPFRVFVSYAPADREPARELLRVLSRQRNARVFTMDMLSAGGDWQAKLKRELTESDVFVLLVSSRTTESDFVLQELGAAWALDKTVVLVLANPEVVPDLDLSPDVLVLDLSAPDLLVQQFERLSRLAESSSAMP